MFLFDDALARGFEPFATTRPLSEMRVGALLQRERWQHALGEPMSGFVSAPHLEGFEEAGAPCARSGEVPAGSWLVNSRAVAALPPGGPAAAGPSGSVLTIESRVAAVRLAQAIPLAQVLDGGFSLEDVVPIAAAAVMLPGRWLDHVWDLVAQLPSQLLADLPPLVAALGATPLPTAGATVLGEFGVFAEGDVTVEPLVVFDTTSGPVLLRRGASVQAFSRVVGPCVIGRESAVLGGRVTNCAIGDVCRVQGELSTSILVGHSNKGHDGFVGHSVLGRWVNLGAGTTTSNLKNTYGAVSLWTPHGVQRTGLQFLGTLFGDHAKTGIGLRLSTGTVIGAASSVFDAMPPKAVAPFSWGGSAPYAAFAIEKFLETAERVMARRQITLSESARAWWRRVHAQAATDVRWPRC